MYYQMSQTNLLKVDMSSAVNRQEDTGSTQSKVTWIIIDLTYCMCI